ncbi:MAG: rhodanese-like domain-containing protein [Elusimicrobiota bacterium]|nr:MAG: rhodanese-like domain-containing protein [Elusimicrobiota bacterium]
MPTKTAVRGKAPPVVTKDELLERLAAGEALQVLNVLDPSRHSLGLIRGSLAIPYAELPRRWSELDKSREVVTYCSDPASDRARMAAEWLGKRGFRASRYDGGIREWAAAGLPLE